MTGNFNLVMYNVPVHYIHQQCGGKFIIVPTTGYEWIFQYSTASKTRRCQFSVPMHVCEKCGIELFFTDIDINLGDKSITAKLPRNADRHETYLFYIVGGVLETTVPHDFGANEVLTFVITDENVKNIKAFFKTRSSKIRILPTDEKLKGRIRCCQQVSPP